MCGLNGRVKAVSCFDWSDSLEEIISCGSYHVVHTRSSFTADGNSFAL